MDTDSEEDSESMWEIDDLSDSESEIENEQTPVLNPWNGMAPKELRVNVDSIVVNAFETYDDLIKRNPNTEIGRREFRTAKSFIKNSNIKKDVYRQSTPGREVIKYK